MKKLLLLLLLPIMAMACVSSPSAQSKTKAVPDALSYTPGVHDTESGYPPEPLSGKTAFDYFKDENLRSGWNLGNSLDAHHDGWAEERRWGNPYINQEIINGVKAAGFDIIRIPVTWMGNFGDAPDYHIDEQYLKRVAEVVGYAHKAGLKVIINLHHDGSSPRVNNDLGWISINRAAKSKLFGDYSEYQNITYQFGRIWIQIATYFKDYGDWLFFESMNEVHDGGWGWSTDFRIDTALQFEIFNEWNQLFTDAVRGTGGNNEGRYLVIPSYCTIPEATYPGGSMGSVANVGDYFRIPADTVPDKQVITFHYYRPDEVGLGANGGSSSWGTAGERQQIDDDFAPFKRVYIDHSIPVIIGETGAIRLMYPDDPAKDARARETRQAYLVHIFATAKKYGLVPVYWDNGNFSDRGERFGLFDRNTGRPNSEESRALIQAMINAVK